MVAPLIKSLYLPVIKYPIARASPFVHNPGGLHTNRLALATNNHLKMRNTLAAVVLCLCSFATNAKGLTQIYYGNIDCGTWVSNPNTASKSWLLGYLTAANSFVAGQATKQTDYLKGVTGNQLFAWMDKYCKENPLNEITDGIHPLLNELIAKNSKEKSNK